MVNELVVAYSRYYLGIYLEELWKITKRLSQDNGVSQPRFELNISRKQVLSTTARLIRSARVT
jgi:hypothetical protein